MDIRELDRRAVRGSVKVVTAVTAADLARPTPCAGWTLADLLAHMTAQHHGFAAAARGHGADPEVWRSRPVEADPVADYTAAAAEVIAAFAGEGALTRPFALPEFGPGVTFPGERAIGFHLIDYLVHGWDAARALGVPYEPDPEVVTAAMPIARAVPDDERRRTPGAAFAPGGTASPGAPEFDRILVMLGRSPEWVAG